MKKLFLFILSILLVLPLISCEKEDQEQEIPYEAPTGETISLNFNKTKGDLTSFNLLSPANGSEVVKDIPTFSWESSTNAKTYTLEICSDTSFSIYASTYIKKTSIKGTTYTLDTYLKTKECSYYWRVTAVNDEHTLKSTDEYRSFYLKSPDYGEIEFAIDYADEWQVHKDGSQCKVSIDKNDFFNIGKNSLQIDFDSTQTNQGITSSDGWMVVTHTQETEMYGVDAFYFNFYYNGQDANVYLRVIDEDNEYYQAPIKLATNAQQVIIIKFSDFALRTNGNTPIVNENFDYNYIKAVELVFEQTFGDGVCLVSNLKAIHYDDYKDLFIQDFNFNDYDSSKFVNDNYTFTTTVSQDGSTFTMNYAGNINGYGFVKIPVEKMIINSDCFKVKITHTGSNTQRILLRIIEQDSDRWVYKQDCSTLVDGELIIPFTSFTLSEANGDGSRQFYYIKQIQFGIENAWGQGSVTYEDLSVGTMTDEIDDLYINTISQDGLIENFEEYDTGVELYYNWQLSSVNKDESMNINKQYTPSSTGKSGVFTYKSDMYPAVYGLQFSDGVEGFTSLKFDVMDASIKKITAIANEFNHLGDCTAKLIVTIYVTKGETYTYVIDSLEKTWTRYDIAFTDFELDEGYSVYSATPLNSKNIRGISFGLQFYYLDTQGKGKPQYTSSNPVYFDNIMLEKSSITTIDDCTTRVKPSISNTNIAVIDDFESYTSESILESYTQAAYDYSNIELVTDNNDQCIKLQYKGNSTSVSYGKNFVVDTSVQAKALILDIKGDDKATVYINYFLDFNGTILKYRYALNDVSSTWTRYTIGFENFTIQDSTSDHVISKTKVYEMNKITIGIVNYDDYNLSNIYIDNIQLSLTPSYTALSQEALTR